VSSYLAPRFNSTCLRGDWAKGTVLLGPDTINVKVVPADEDVRGCVTATFASIAASGLYVLAPCTSETSMSPLWCVSSTEDDRIANMVWQTIAVQHVSGSDFVGGFGPAPKAGRKKDTAVETNVRIPFLINSKALKSGDELIFHKAKIFTPKRPIKAISVTEIVKAKKIRTDA
jgi:hypothetical protein